MNTEIYIGEQRFVTFTTKYWYQRLLPFLQLFRKLLFTRHIQNNIAYHEYIVNSKRNHPLNFIRIRIIKIISTKCWFCEKSIVIQIELFSLWDAQIYNLHTIWSSVISQSFSWYLMLVQRLRFYKCYRKMGLYGFSL